jgi:D-alanyl-D-alanine carboxypeptidase/D-alanyl-D-alanine-endopeptidase (penicillin-binding protein 4)
MIGGIRALCVLTLLFASSAKGAPIYEQILKSKSESVTRSVQVMRLSDGKVLFESNASQLLSPASVTKVLTSAVALAKLTPAFRFTTDFYATPSPTSQGTYQDLYVVGGGDPYLVSEQLWQAVADLKHLGVKEFKGDIVIDSSLFGDDDRDESRKDGAKKSRHAYDAPVSAFAINFNTYAIAVAPGSKLGAPAAVSLDPYNLPPVTLVNQVKTSKKTSLSIKREAKATGAEQLIASGEIAVDAPMQKIYRSVTDPLVSSGAILRTFLEKAGITVKGLVRAGIRPPSAKLLLTLESYEMRRIIQGLNVFSNNFIADSLIKRIGARFPKDGEADMPGSGTLEAGLDVLRNYLVADIGIKEPFILENASGLAPQNRLSSAQVVKVLATLEKQMEIFPEFLGSLPAIGWEGTLKKRFNRNGRDELKGLVRAKTGTLTEPVSVSSIAGYFRHAKHGLIAFCIIENGVAGKKQPGIAELKEGQDKALASLVSDL